MKPLLSLIALLAVLAPATPAAAAEPTPVTVDLLVYYTPSVVTRYGSGLDTRLQHLVNVTNDSFAQSESGVRVRIVHQEEIAFGNQMDSGDALDAISDGDGVFAGVAAKRNQVGADLVVLMRPYLNDGTCGVAWLGGYRANGDFSRSRGSGYSHVSIDCSDATFGHELGHNMGLSHSRRQNGQGGTYPWALGHGVDGRFVTMMAYGSAFGAPRVSRFSSPNLQCNGLPCGVDRNDPIAGADAVHTLRHARTQVAAYTAAVAPSPPPPPPPISPPTPPPVPNATIEITGPTVKLVPLATTSITWQASSDIATVEVYYRLERKKKGSSKWKKNSWHLLSAAETDGQFDWTVPNPAKKKKKKTRVRFLVRGYDSSGIEVAADTSRTWALKR
jgi:hypothetical protein